MQASLAKRPPVPTVPPTPPAAPSLIALRAAVEQQLRAMLDEGVSGLMLVKMERFCHSAREALLTVETPQNLLRERLGGGGNIGMGQTFGLGGGAYLSSPYAPITLPDGSELPMPSLAPAPGNETYGANVVRELIAAATKIGDRRTTPSLLDLITSLNMARATKNKRLMKIAEAEIEKHYGSAAVDLKVPSTKKKKRGTVRVTG